MAKADNTKEAKLSEENIDGDIQEADKDTQQAASQEEPKVAEEAPEVKTKATAKAGKRSEKSIKQAEEKVAKEERKAAAETEEADKTTTAPAPHVRSKLERRGKQYRQAAELIDKDTAYSLSDATALISKTSKVKFDASVELHVRLDVDPRQADQNIRQMVVLPHGSGKTVRIAVFAEPDQHDAAKKAGADIVGADDLLQTLDKGEINFDVLIATPSLMARLGKYAKVLGPKGLMPNPKSGTVAKDVAKAVTEAKGGRIEYRVDSSGNIHVAMGKVSFEPKQLLENGEAIMSSIRAAKPASVKGNYLLSAHLTTTMGPSVRLSL